MSPDSYGDRLAQIGAEIDLELDRLEFLKDENRALLDDARGESEEWQERCQMLEDAIRDVGRNLRTLDELIDLLRTRA